jgi:hypothetical protein
VVCIRASAASQAFSSDPQKMSMLEARGKHGKNADLDDAASPLVGPVWQRLLSPRIRAVATLTGVGALVLHLVWLALALGDTRYLGADGLQVWAQAERIRAGEPLYTPLPADYGPHVMTGTHDYPIMTHSPYLPPLAALVSLFPRMEPLTFTRLHLVFVFALAWTYAALLTMLVVGRVTPAGWFAAIGVITLIPGSFNVLTVNNIEPLLWCLVGAAYVFPRLRAGMLLAAGAVKVHALWPLIALLLSGQRIALRAAAAAGAVLITVTLLALGFPGTVAAAADWLRHVPAGLGQGTFRWGNISLSFLPLRVARWVGWDYQAGPLPLLPRAWLLAASTVAPILAIGLTRRMTAERKVAIVLAVALLASPLCWSGYLTALLAPAAWALGSEQRGLRAGGGPAQCRTSST